jgi:3-deoxy-manno-octulosonate cytidylyltransferase (CMP-KDO synthetase)
MRTIGIIPVRMGSSRFPGKPLALIHGRPMIRWVFESAQRARSIYPLFVATPDKEIIDYCEREHLPHIVTAFSCRSGTERVFNALRQIGQHEDEDIVMNIQGDEPTIRPESLDLLAHAFADPKIQIASLFYRAAERQGEADPNRVKVILTKSRDAFAFTRKAVRREIDHGIHVGIYAYRRVVLSRIMGIIPSDDLEQIAWLRAGFDIRMIEIDYAPKSVDVLADLALAERLLVHA